MKLSKHFKVGLLSLLVVVGSSLFNSCSSDDDAPSPALSSANSITSFVFSGLTPPVGGTISDNAVAVTVPGTVDVTALSPTVVISQKATVVPTTGTAQNFSSPVVYKVTAEDGSERSYTVTVTKSDIQSNEAEITSFVLDALTPPVDGIITDTDIELTVPFDVDVTTLVPTIVISTSASIAPATGVAQDFTSPVVYTVTAQNGTTKEFTVTIVKEAEPVVAIVPIWQQNLVAGGLPSWYTANNDRDLSVSSEYLYVHNNNDKIRVLSLTDGSDISAGVTGDLANPNSEYINGTQNFASGNLFLLGTSTDSQGKIVASNLRVGSDALNPWNVYKWDSKDSAQELLFAYPTPAGVRLGDNITVVGDITADATLYAPASGTNRILKFDISDGTASNVPAEITLAGLTSLGNAPDVDPVSDTSSANLIVSGTGVEGIAEYAQDGSLVGKLDAILNDGETAPLFTFALDVKAFEIAGRKLIATTATDFTQNAADAGYLYIIDYTDGLENVSADNIQRIAFTPSGNIDTNLNGTGGVDVTVDGDEATVYAMLTNFGIGAYRVTYE